MSKNNVFWKIYIALNIADALLIVLFIYFISSSFSDFLENIPMLILFLVVSIFAFFSIERLKKYLRKKSFDN